MSSPIDKPLPGAVRREIGGVVIDEVAAGNGRVKRILYPPGWRWQTHMRPVTSTERCMHAHVGFLVQGRVTIEYADGCRVDFAAPTAVVIAPGHDGWVVGDDPAVLIQFDWARDTAARLGLEAHSH